MNKKYRYQKRFADAAMEILYSYVWPGNVRELKNVVEQAVIPAPGTISSPPSCPLPAGLRGRAMGGTRLGV